ncbi:hypothetical protein U9M48_018234 [Paspalum notatum var. saurae]|uniref:Uncharacterized protein n=1 Tax=Paspalum notatum var. saurae TaxID=547442 RepID=A0AAQ3TD01_PASNO
MAGLDVWTTPKLYMPACPLQADAAILLVLLVVIRLMVLQDPPPVGPLHHVLVVVHLPAHGHGVLVGEAVVELVHQRHVPVHHQLEPAAAAVALPASDAVQVDLEVVRLRLAAVGLEERRPARVDEQLHAHVGVAHGRVVRDAVGLVPDAEHPEVRQPVEDVPEVAVPRARAAEHHGGHRGRTAAVAQGPVVRIGDDVDGVEGGQGRAQAVPNDADARLLVLRTEHTDLHPGTLLAELGALVRRRVQRQPSAPSGPRIPAAEASASLRSATHSSARCVPRHATTMSLRPSAAAPSSVATATYPIQLHSRARPWRQSGRSSTLPRTSALAVA